MRSERNPAVLFNLKYTLLLISFLLFAQTVIAQEVPIPPIFSRSLTNKEIVETEFQDVPRMIDVIQCESGFKQFKDGKPLKSNTSDIGVMQINPVHFKEAKKLGLDIFNSAEDNVRMGRIIYEQQGIRAWVCNAKID